MRTSPPTFEAKWPHLLVWPSMASIALALLATQTAYSDESDTIRFNRDIRPILAAACFRCHGLDEGHRQAELRLDIRDNATESRSTGRGIAPGDRTASLVWDRIHASDSYIVMPPPSSPRQLTEQERELLGRWIDQGAPYEAHWSFEQVGAPKLPEGDVAAGPIDRYLQFELQRRGMVMNERADPRTLARRVSFALTGLPPDPETVEAFVATPTDEAYSRMVDRMLESPHYGEEMAKHWLDVARYGDTHGLHLDNDRRIWPYRDWVVRAFQDNMPFDQFTIEQLAGDLLPNPTQSQLVATGFNRCNVTTAEGGAIDEEFLYRYAVDRASTTISTWLGLTGGCAVCHDHKYDPLTTRDFYSMYSFFYSAADPAMDGNINTTAPFLKLPTTEQLQELDRLQGEESATLGVLMELAQAWSRVSRNPTESAVVTPKPITSIALDDELPLGAVQRNTSRNGIEWSPEQISPPMGRRSIATRFGHKYELTINSMLVPMTIPDAAHLQVWIHPDAQAMPSALFVEVKTDKGNRRWIWADTPEDARKVDGQPDRIAGPIPKGGVWFHANIPIEGLPAGAIVQEWKLGLFGGICYWDGLAISGIQRSEDKLTTDIVSWWNHRKGQSAPHASSQVANAVKQGPDSDVGKQHADQVKAYFIAMVASEIPAEIREARERWQTARIARQMLEDRIPGTMIFKDRPEPRQAHVMTRGQYDAKGEAVRPATPSFLPARIDSDSHLKNRLDLAQWLVSNDNPLVARVIVNRFWQQMFGTGIVKSSDDFGTQGMPPTHPELLDYLADRFRSSGWNVKQLMRELAMSEAFRRDSKFIGTSPQLDPENRYLARGPRLRLDAEQIRDNALAISGLLNRQIGGPGFLGYQPPDIWEPVGYGDSNTRYYIQQHGEDLYRRSLYAYIKRTAPPPFLSNFDAPNRETSCTRRERSNTPLQALQLMNDIQHFEAARCFAERVVREIPSSTESLEQARVARAFVLALGRAPDPTEQEELQHAFQQFRDRLQATPEDSLRIARAGERWPDPNLNPHEVAPWVLVCNLILNLDETITRN
ncbi:MAG: DUF1553 domain-containing protein [Planctomycetes bacterium]|nr:DUF1553 domain-containing protein [Planctomycetota bacterium]